MANREIKFRTFKNGMMSRSFKFGEAICFPDGSVSVGRNFELMQYTGLKDANGVEIYEGDIVEYLCEFTEETSNHQVKYFCKDDYPAFDFSPSISDDMNGFSALVYQEIGTVKVIGNIYQNPELLNG